MVFKKSKNKVGEHCIRFNHYSSYGCNITHIFIDNVYLDSTVLSTHNWDKKKTYKQDIESQILEPVFNGSKYSFKNTYNNEHSKDRPDDCYIFEYIVSSNSEKTTYEKMKEKFNSKKGWGNSYYNNYSIRDIQEEYMYSSCVEIGGSYIREPRFNEIILEQSKALVKYVEDNYGVRIKITKLPGYNERNSGMGADFVNFYYKIEKVVDKNKLTVETKDIDFVNKIVETINIHESSLKEINDITALNPKSFNSKKTIREAAIGMSRYLPDMFVIKQNEKELLEDYEGFKRVMWSSLISESSFSFIGTKMMLNFKKFIPELYSKLFGDLPAGLLPSLLHNKCQLMGFPKNCKSIEDIYDNFTKPEMK